MPVSKPRKLSADTSLKQADTEKKREALFVAKRRILRQMFKEGLVTEAESREQYIALDVILRLIKGPTTRPELKFLCAKELWPHEAMTLAEQSRLDAADAAGGPPQISITVQPFAFAGPTGVPSSAVGPTPRALPEPIRTVPDPTETVIVESDMPRTNGTTPAPPLSDRKRLREQVRAQRETVVIEAPVSPSEPAHVIGRVNQGKPYELGENEKRRIMKTLQKRPQ
jgi:hypothetical protein